MISLTCRERRSFVARCGDRNHLPLYFCKESKVDSLGQCDVCSSCFHIEILLFSKKKDEAFNDDLNLQLRCDTIDYINY